VVFLSECESIALGTTNQVSGMIVEQPLLCKPIITEKPVEMKRWKCHTCYTVLNDNQLIDNKCPQCGEPHLAPMCKLDNIHCSHNMVSGLKYCPDCGQPICPVEGCFSHDVFQLSRVTGYLGNIQSYNQGKRAEVRDRTRVQNIERVLD
jgi:predicted RNA-binding Zn-ribbon protein involved in translation (DUF1610 family)